MASLYAQYLMERTTDQIIETDEGFASYRYINDGKTVYIVDIFIVESKRKSGMATHLADAIARGAKDRGCTEMIGSVVPSMKNSTASMRVLLGYGMSLASAGNDFVIFRKDL